jgi:aminoglycoside 2''-phosphotransferase
MHPQENYLTVIKNILPEQDWSKNTCEYISTGQYNDILMINDEIIFRFPKVLESLAQLKVETYLLKSIREFLPLEIPDPLFENLEGAPIRKAFMGYYKIPGEPLWPRTLAVLGSE